MSLADVVAFYSAAHWGSRYGVVDAAHRTPHKGLDLGLFHGTVDVPALHGGTVVAAAASSFVGHYVTVARDDGLFDTYCHIVLGVSVGQTVSQGTRLGRQAVTQAEGGLQWEGQHTHLCLSRTRDGWGVWGYVNLDPTPGVIAVLTEAASAGGSMIDNTVHGGDSDMSAVLICKGSTVASGRTVDSVFVLADLALRDPSNWKVIKSTTLGGPGDLVAIVRDGITPPSTPRPAIVLGDADFEAWHTWLTTPPAVGSVTVAPDPAINELLQQILAELQTGRTIKLEGTAS